MPLAGQSLDQFFFLLLLLGFENKTTSEARDGRLVSTTDRFNWFLFRLVRRRESAQRAVSPSQWTDASITDRPAIHVTTGGWANHRQRSGKIDCDVDTTGVVVVVVVVDTFLAGIYSRRWIGFQFSRLYIHFLCGSGWRKDAVPSFVTSLLSSVGDGGRQVDKFKVR